MSTTNSARVFLRSTALGLSLAALSMSLSACKASPCSDSNAELPPNLAKLPILDETVSVCQGSPTEPGVEKAMVMRWGDDISSVQTKLILEMDNAGWAQTNGCGLENQLCFDKGEESLSALFQAGKSKQLGLDKPAIITNLTWYGPKTNP
ncbi:hypothetical protein ENSA5_58660 [Enhygromyxa salina]|uniref:Lipoprotein n=1 Tax=Enhygromyxa salina TaxID=215803 RepID=A0A2S9XE41_9BACT|nr:hypothetical protein [Enhygromyxa salina]PRP91129.1 hypothetical protein ENSA5_58660 [Enhygromyxa salina]